MISITNARRSRGVAAAVCAAVASLAAVGCGGSAHPRGTTVGSASPQGMAAKAFEFSRCMRSHGVANFPDPIVSSASGHQEIAVRVTPSETSSSQFNSAQSACRGIMPDPTPSQVASQQRHEEQGKLAFARCMRAHGIQGFPDPTPQGQITPAMASAAGVDIRSPAVLGVAMKCVAASDGTVSAADIRSVQEGKQ
jgi:hypothetical protein